MEKLSKRKSIIKGQLTKMNNFVKANSEELCYEELKARLDHVHRLYSEFVEVEDKIFELDAKIASEMDIVDETYFSIVTKVQTCIRNIVDPTTKLDDSQNFKVVHPTSDFKLPSLAMPSFDGNLQEWQSFFDIYTSTIHENVSLTPAQKFKYLKGLLKGSAYDLIRHFRVDDTSYIEAYQRLVKRFNKKRPIVESYIKSLFNQTKLTKSTASSLTQIHDHLDEVVRGLKALGQDAESRDPWLIYIVLEKLDEETRQAWKFETAETDFPTLQEFLDFLLKRMYALTESTISKTSPTNKPVHSKSQSVAKSFYIPASVSCPLCQGETHRLFECAKFTALAITQRRDFLKTHSRCFNCLSDTHNVYQCKSRRRCRTCNKKHNTLVHMNLPPVTDTISSETSATSTAVNVHVSCADDTTSEIVMTMPINHGNAILPTVLIQIKNRFNTWQDIRGLLDSASTRSFITESCVKRLQLGRSNLRVIIETINKSKAAISRGITNFKIRSRLDNGYEIDVSALIVPSITSNLPPKDLDKSLIFTKDLPLADPMYYQSNPIDILIGCDHFLNIIEKGKVTNIVNDMVALNTKFGWIVGGSCGTAKVVLPDRTLLNIDEEVNIDRILKRFWEIEELPLTPKYTNQELLCIEHFEKTVRRDDTGRIIVKLPFKSEPPNLGISLNQAIQRFYALERRLLKDSEFRSQYVKFMNDYLHLGHMEPVPAEDLTKNSNLIFYLPHHGVIRESSTTSRLRVVFDGSAKTSNGFSLNDQLTTGPTVQSTLVEILLRFRKHKYTFSADIEKMFRQLRVTQADAEYQRILWRESPNKQLQHYRLLTVTYGTSSAPFLSTYALNYLANQFNGIFPKAAKIIKNDVYVDDFMSGANTLDEAWTLQKEVREILHSAGLRLRKWSANHPDLLKQFSDDELSIPLREVTDGTKTIAVLGLCYLPYRDIFKFQVKLSKKFSVTKRQLLSETSRIFDPMGWLTPVIVTLKIMFQQLWLEKLEWDDQLPGSIRNIWLNLRNELHLLEDIEIGRWLYTSDIIEIHGFSDASKDAYAAVLYARVILPKGEVKVTMISAKSKVAPIKTVSIPRLELCAATLLVNLLQSTIKALQFESSPRIFMYTDSTIVLDWLSGPPKSWPTFIGNRTSQILSHTNRTQWFHVSSSDNPADCASRGIKPSEIKNYHLWWQGPNWLHFNPIPFPKPTINVDHSDEPIENATVNIVSNIEETDILHQLYQRVSRYNNIVRIIARIKRLLKNASRDNVNKKSGSFSVEELSLAEHFIFRNVQHEIFQDEITLLRSGKSLKKSKIINFFPFLDKTDILRVGGRLENSELSYNMKHPIILPGDHILTRRLIEKIHLELLHAGSSHMLAQIRQRFQIIKGKHVVKRVVRACMRCHRYNLKQQSQLMGQLPYSRVRLERPFLQTGIDYAGPFAIKAHQQRNSKIIKGYMAIFVCMATKAVHMELVTNLSTNNFIAALIRFQAIRGICSDIFSDNGSNFVGARNQLQELQDMFNSEKAKNEFKDWGAKQGTRWHFIPPAAPSFGGLWESAVKSCKFHIRRVIGETILNYEELITLLKQIEAIMNSRPLFKDDERSDAITPAHFLIGNSLTLMPEPTLLNTKINHLSRWQMVQYMTQHIWRKWYQEYLTTLNKVTKWYNKNTNFKIGDIVILREDNSPPATWPMARIVDVHPGKDNLIRVVTLKTSKGIYKRPIQKLCLLPSFDSSESSEARC